MTRLSYATSENIIGAARMSYATSENIIGAATDYIVFNNVVEAMKQSFKDLCYNIDKSSVPLEFQTAIIASGKTSSRLNYRWNYKRNGIDTITAVRSTTLDEVIDKVLRDNDADFTGTKIISVQDIYYIFNVIKKFISEHVTMYISIVKEENMFNARSIYVIDNVS